MATRDDGLRSEITDLLLDAEHRDELQRVGVWAFDHVAKSEATGQIAAVLNAVASAASTEWVWRAVDLKAASSDELRSLAIVASVLRGETEWRQDGVTAENSTRLRSGTCGPRCSTLYAPSRIVASTPSTRWRRPGGFRRSTPTPDARCSGRRVSPRWTPL